MALFSLHSPFQPTGDQPEAIQKLTEGVMRGDKEQTLLGVTGSGKTFTVANVISHVQKPTLVISHNKTLAAQLFQEFREFFPQNAVEYFVSYYDYYQPEAYIPQTDTYIEKDSSINQEIDKLRLSATMSLMTRKDVIVVASVSCIYNIGSPVEYGRFILELKKGQKVTREQIMKRLTDLHYERNDTDLVRGTFRIRGDTVEVYPSYQDVVVRLELFQDKLEKISQHHPISLDVQQELELWVLYPAKHYMTAPERVNQALDQIHEDLQTQLQHLTAEGKALEAHRLKQRTYYDLELIREIGYCTGIENYSRYFDGRKPGQTPFTLLEYFPKDFLLVIDESHMTVPQIRGMYEGDKSRKNTLVEFGFRLPSALDNRPLRFDEFQKKMGQTIYTSATPDDFELKRSKHVVEQFVRPTGILDPDIEIHGASGQIPFLIGEIEKRVTNSERVLVTTLTKRMAEELSSYLVEKGVKAYYLHSDIETLDRSDILDDLRLGKYDVLVGINLLREGLDLPEVSLVAILDADKEGFLRSRTSLIQTMGRAARHVNGKVMLFADKMTDSMKYAIDEGQRRRKIQLEYNKIHHITAKTIQKGVREKLIEREQTEDGVKGKSGSQIQEKLSQVDPAQLIPEDRKKYLRVLQVEMHRAADNLDFEEAALIRDKIRSIEKEDTR